MEITFENIAIILEEITKQFDKGNLSDIELIGHLNNLALILKIVSKNN